MNDLSLRVLKSNFLKAQISSAVIFFLSRTFSISPSVESRRTIANGDPHIVSDGDSGGGGGREQTQQVVFSVAAVPPPPPPPSQFLPSFLGGVMIILPPSYNTINFSRQNDTKRERVKCRLVYQPIDNPDNQRQLLLARQSPHFLFSAL